MVNELTLSTDLSTDTPRFMNVRQVARYLQLNEKKIYALIGEGGIPATKVTGKWMFPKDLIDRWLIESSHGGVLTDRLMLAGGSDPLLYRVVMMLTRQTGSQAHVSYSCTGTQLGLSLLARRRIDLAALHWGPASESRIRHLALLRQFPQHPDWILVRAFQREQGLMVRPEHADDIAGLVRAPLRWAMRQEGSGSQRFLQEAVAQHKGNLSTLQRRTVAVALSEREAAAHLVMDEADIAPGTRGSAREFGLLFVPMGWEAFDFAVTRRVYFRRLFMQLIELFRTEASSRLAGHFGGYDLSESGRIVWAP